MLCQIHAGEVVEEALDVMKARNETGAIQPRHLVSEWTMPDKQPRTRALE